jgi:putative ABC transport system permease protein
MRELGDHVASVPGVEAASVEVGALPLGRGSSSFGFWLASEPRPRLDDLRRTLFYVIGPEYLDVMRLPLRRGRNFTRADDSRAPRVALIDEEFASQAFSDRDPLGQHLRFGFQDEPVEIVGVVGHVKHWGLESDRTAAIRSQLYLPYTQMPDAITSLVPKNTQVVLRSSVPLGTLLPDLRRAVAAFDASQALSDERTMVSEIATSTATRRLALLVLGAFALCALMLSCVGVYGVVSYLTAQRNAEIGVRMAVGARPSDMLWLVIKDGQKVAWLGIGIGLVAAAMLTRFIAHLLYDVAPTDPATLGAVVMILGAVTLVACYIPARRASRLDPVHALRAE